MRIEQQKFDDVFKRYVEDPPLLQGQERFTKNVGKAYLAHVDVYELTQEYRKNALVIDVYSNMKLGELVISQQRGLWDLIDPCTGKEIKAESLDVSLQALKKQNPHGPQLEELNIYLGDCTLVVKRLYHNSIEKELGKILDTLAEHYVHLSQEHTRFPYEIFVPVFSEEAGDSCDHQSHRLPEKCACEYYRFWGLYFEGIKDAVIYDLSKKSFISGDLYMLDQ